MKGCTRKPPWSRWKWNECMHMGTIQDTERLVHKEWSHGFLPSTIPFSSFARTSSVAHDPCCFKILQSNLHSNCRPLKFFLLRSKMNILGEWAVPCCSCLSESFSNPPLSRAGLSLPLQAHSPQQLATGRPLGGENGHSGAIWRRLEAATANLEQLGGTRMSAHSLLNKHTYFIYTFLCTWNKQTQKSSFCCLWMFYFFHASQWSNFMYVIPCMYK